MDKKPILVTGAHRTGTTWVGKMLSASREVTYISEPLNVLHRPGVLRAPVTRWYTHINNENESEYLPAFLETLSFKYHLGLEIKSLSTAKDLLRMIRDGSRFLNGRLRAARPLLKDPFAVFSAPWFAERLGCQVLVTVRHPAAFVSSLKRLDWSFNLSDLLQQSSLVRDHLEPFRHELESAAEKPNDLILQGSLLWKSIYHTVDGFQRRYPDFLIALHEDLSQEPLEQFKEIYTRLGLRFTPRVQQTIVKSTQSGNPREGSVRNAYAVHLDSRVSLSNWKRRLTQDEIERVRHLTSAVAKLFYSMESWE